MSNIDKRALREAAEKATPGVWVYLPKNTSIEYDYGSDDSQGSVTYMDSGDFTQKQTDLNGAFIAAANPVTVLALLDELEAKDRRIEEEIGRANREHHRGFMMACGHLKEHSNVHYADAAEMEIAALRNRINELESAAAGKGEAS